MPTVKIEEKGCRGCEMCVDVCPVDVFDVDAREGAQLAKVARTEDCIGCFSCFYRCPSQCIEIPDAEMQRPFYRIEENVAFVEKFLQEPSATSTLTPADWDEAFGDVAMTIMSLSRASEKMMGRGTRVLGRRAGTEAAAHLPEIYEEPDLAGVLARLRQRFMGCFEFEFRLDEDDIDMTFVPCGLHTVVSEAGGVVGEAVACRLFHDYLAGLLSAYSGGSFRCHVKTVGEHCELALSRG